MCNATFYKVHNEWLSTNYEYGDGFLDFVEENFPEIWSRMQTRTVLGFWREPTPREEQIILKTWQKTHAPIEYRVCRISK